MGKPGPHLVSPVLRCAHSQCSATALFVDALVNHFGVAVEPAQTGAVSGIKLKFD
jgi:hypothetical protein